MRFEPRELPENNVSRTHPAAELVTLVGGIALAAVVLTAVLALLLDVLIARVPPSVEKALFGGMWSQLTDPQGTPDPRLAPTRALLDRLLAHGPAGPLPIRVGILEKEEEVNAFALPGGTLLVTSGLLDRVGSENELAFVLAHEIGHFRCRHHLRGLSRSLAVGLVLAAVSRGSLSDSVPVLASRLTELSFARHQEREADRVALGLLEAEYGHVAGATAFFARLPDAGQRGAGTALAGWLGSHPTSSERIAALEALARSRGWPTEGPLTPLPAVFGRRRDSGKGPR